MPDDRLVPMVNGVPDWERQGAVDMTPEGGTVRLRIWDHKHGKLRKGNVEFPIGGVRPAPLYRIGDRVQSLPGSTDFGVGKVVGIESNGWELDVEWDMGIFEPGCDWRTVRPADGDSEQQETEAMAKRKTTDNGYETAAGAASDTAVADRKPRRRRRAEQAALIDTQHPEDKAIIQAAERYRALRDDRMGLLKDEIEARTRLLDMMHAASLTVYEHGDLRIEVVSTEKVKVRSVGDEEGGDGEE
ncbi:MAG TPA: hypothetical protein PLU35_13775 [Phycisphaerales bacterium]|nr:hypothetical protein [Phycisphaerales bacterium]